MHIIDTRGKRSTATKTEYFDCFVKKIPSKNLLSVPQNDTIYK